MTSRGQDGPQIPPTQAKTAKGRPSFGPMPGKPSRAPAAPPPAGLSPWAKRVWRELKAANDFAENETVTFTRALTWFDLSDSLLAEAAGLSGRERDAKVKSAGDAATTALRFWRSLKFVDPATPARKPGRPPGRPRLPEEAAVLRFHA